MTALPLNIDSLEASSQITLDYKRYLRSLLPISDPILGNALTEVLKKTHSLVKGPYLEATPPFVRSSSLRELIEDGVLPGNFEIFHSQALPLDRPLYNHQVEAIRKVVNNRNIIVSTGTGSGKTESFLIPILAHLAKEMDQGILNSGIRALLLYPMNALANDQMKRLRQILASVPEITFGRYVGDTKTKKSEAEDRFREQNPGEPRLPNELISREEMQATPPHFLLTNYAMLEYLLLRPKDMDLFERRNANSWKYLIVDEAHTYDGSRGAEFAMLLRRLKQRVGLQNSLQFIATSATVGAKENPGKVIEFAENLFGGKFEWQATDTSRQDLITSTFEKEVTEYWGELGANDYLELLRIDDPSAMMKTKFGIDPTSNTSCHSMLSHEKSIVTLRRALLTQPLTLGELTSRLGSEWSSSAISNLVALGSRTFDSNGVPLLSARYHLWLRASEGAFTCLSKIPHVNLARQEVCLTCSRPVYEFGCCTRCGVTYIVGTEVSEGSEVRLTPRLKTGDEPTWIALDNEVTLEDEDDQLWDESELEVKDEVAICAPCGTLNIPTHAKCSACGSEELRKGRVVRSKSRTISGCIACGSRTNGQVRLLDSGSDASSAVIATSLYQNIPNDTGIPASLPGKGRKLLVFSDSRQSAAYFAPYFESTYSRLVERRFIWQGLNEAYTESERPVSFKRLANQVLIEANKKHFFSRELDDDDREAQVNLWLSREIVAFDHRQSLEGLGMLKIGIYFPEDFKFTPGFQESNLTENQLMDLITTLLTFTRKQMGVAFPRGVNPSDPIFSPRLGPIGITEGSDKKKVINWSPRRGNNVRLDYLRRVLEKTNSTLEPDLLLSKIWELLISPNYDFLTSFLDEQGSPLSQFNYKLLRFEPSSTKQTIFKCNVCGGFSSSSVLATCPKMRCNGQLVDVDITSSEFENSHYRHIYENLDAIPVKVMEHTAQWAATEAAQIQTDFVAGKTNILSCSTTFELGVDVGELQSVFLKNVPPSTANYVQRAGRAGRRNASAALVVSFAQRRSHDLSRFAEPKSTINGIVRPPIVPLGNHRIDRRHVHSVALSLFFREVFSNSGTNWTNVGTFFAPKEGELDAVELLQDYLSPCPEKLLSALNEILDTGVREKLGIPEGAWIPVLLDQIKLVKEEVNFDLGYFQEAQDAAAAKGYYKEAEVMKGVINTLSKRNLLGYLGSKNILPKYGFPVDVVELRTQNSSTPIGTKLELSRDLTSAVFEYAPGNQIVAGGLLWQSAGVYKLPNRELVRGGYSQCRSCQHFYYALDETLLPDLCEECLAPLPRKRFLIPEFGFIAERKPTIPSSSPPERSWNGDTYFVRSDQPLHLSSEGRANSGMNWALESGEQQRLLSVSTGPAGAGFYICEKCGRGFPAAEKGNPPTKHGSAWTDKDCKGRTRLTSLVHQYETDVLSLRLQIYDTDLSKYWSVLYGIMEGAAEKLEISRDDINGTLSFGHGSISIVIFDTVPGGAGCVLQIGRDFEDVLRASLSKLENCECGEQTSCYSCLRSFRNQMRHDQLSRGEAIKLLKDLI